MTDIARRLPFSLFTLRVGVAIVMIMWTIDKFVRPEHAAGVFGHFYALPGLGEGVFYALGAIELVVVLAFLAGAWRTWTYGAVLVLHAISTLSSFRQYFAPFEGPNLLFFAAWPMLAACLTLFLLREADTFLAMPGRESRTGPVRIRRRGL